MEKHLKVPILPRLAAQKMLICLSVLWEFKSQLGELSMDKDIPIVNKSNTDLLYSWKKCFWFSYRKDKQAYFWSPLTCRWGYHCLWFCSVCRRWQSRGSRGDARGRFDQANLDCSRKGRGQLWGWTRPPLHEPWYFLFQLSHNHFTTQQSLMNIC